MFRRVANNPLIKDFLIIIISALTFGFVYNLIIHKDFNFIEKALSKTIPGQIKDHSQLEQIKEISIDEALNYINSFSPLVIDARTEKNFMGGKIKDAINIYPQNLDKYIDFIFALPKDTLIIIYCEGIHCNLSHQLAEKLLNFGFSNLNIMYEGIEGWQKRNLPVISDEQ